MRYQRGRSPKQRRYDRFAILDYIQRYQQVHNERSPSQRRICGEFNISAPSVVHNILHGLERDGYLHIIPLGRGLSADLEITAAGLEQLQIWRAQQR